MNSPETQVDEAGQEGSEKTKLALDVQVQKPSACERQITVTIARDDVDRYLKKAYAEIMPGAQVPGFRAGRAPRRLVEQRFREQVSDQVKGSLLMDSMAQISEDYDFSAISEPDFDFDAIDLPEKGPMKFEFRLEVRPEFDLPEWKGLKLDKLTRDFSSKDVDLQLTGILSREGTLEPVEDAAQEGDFVVCNVRTVKDGRPLSVHEEVTIQLLANVNFPDGRLEGFSKLMAGVKAGESRSAKIVISHDAPSEELQGQTVDVEFQVLEVKRVSLPQIDSELLSNLGDFETEGDLRDAVLGNLKRRMEYEQQQRTRGQISSLLTKSANWELPPDLVKRQAKRELERAILEMRSAGFPEDEIQAYENELRQNSLKSTRKALAEHFILERIAEENKIEADPADYEAEVRQIAEQSRESIRRIRARIEKKGWMDALRNQIIERKVLQLITDHAEFQEVKYDPERRATAAVSQPLCGQTEASIPEAKYEGEAQSLQQPVDRS
jgi:trigger factor